MRVRRRGLPLEILTGPSVPAGEGSYSVVEEVRRNLFFLLNTRQGTVPHLPDFGLPELSRVYANEPKCVEYLRGAIQALIMRYEPRLADVRVHALEGASADNDLGMVYRIDARIQTPQGERVAYQTAVRDVEEVKVDPLVGAKR